MKATDHLFIATQREKSAAELREMARNSQCLYSDDEKRGFEEAAVAADKSAASHRSIAEAGK